MATQNSTRLTDKFIRSIKPPAKGSKLYADAEVRGLALRAYASGRKSFTLVVTVNGDTLPRQTLATWPEFNATAARQRAVEYRKLAAEGIDPFEEPEITTLGELADSSLDGHAATMQRATTALKDKQTLERIILPELGAKTPVEKITRQRLNKLRTRMKDTPIQFNRTLALLSKMFSEHFDNPADNPCRKVQRFPEVPREVYLSTEELQRLLVALDEFPDRTIASALVLMILTGCRKGEALNATWDQFDLERGVWTKPSHHTKQKRAHRIPLNPAAVALLKGVPHTDSVYVFPGRVEGQPLQDIKKAWEKLRQAAELPHVRMHDLRHTYARLLAAQNLSLPTIGALLGHTQAQTTNRYAHLIDDKLREATNGVGKLIEDARS